MTEQVFYHEHVFDVKILGVYGDIGPTVPDTHSPDDDR
jgi:hypothetical protein